MPESPYDVARRIADEYELTSRCLVNLEGALTSATLDGLSLENAEKFARDLYDNFELMQVTPIYMVHITDLSHLGGMMGTEYTTEIAAIPCKTLESAELAFRQVAARYHVRQVPQTIEVGKAYDFGSVGLSIAAVEAR